MRKQMRIMLICCGILFGGIFLFKVFAYFMMKRALSNQVNIVSVSTMKVETSAWEPTLHASGSLRAIRGVNVTTQLAGMVSTIYFTPGSVTQKDQLLVQLNADTEIAQLHSLQASENLAKITYERDKAQYAIHAVSKQIVDNDLGQLHSLQAQVEQQATIVAKKSIRAPFTGRLGINYVNPGQYINPGDNIVTLQTLDPIYADFFIPQQNLPQLKVGQTVEITLDTDSKLKFQGKISTINPLVDATTRNVAVEATVKNINNKLSPGMFCSVNIIVAKPVRLLTVPQTAISFNPYGSLVYVIRQSGKNKKGEAILIAKQHFVTTGETRGEQISVLTGLKEGDVIVTSGQLKLKNGSQIAVNNSILLPNNPNPKLSNDH